MRLGKLVPGCLVFALAVSGTAGAGQEEKPGQDDGEDAVLEKLLDQARDDLAERLEIAVEGVKTVRAERVVWRNSALGCPEPDRMYLQALQDGALFELKAKKKTYRYHSDLEGPPFYCEKPSKKDPLPAADDGP